MCKNKVYMVTFLCIFVPAVVFGQPQLRSSIDSLELSGEQCPGTLTLTCDARNFETSGTINWFAGDDRLAVFDVVVDPTPFTTTTSPNLLNATVKLESATPSNGQFSYTNFTLSASLSDFLSLQGQNITCGSLLMRSSSFEITEFTVINESSVYPDTEVSYLVNYNGLNGKLAEIVLCWIERAPNCKSMFSYSVRISNGVNFMTRNFTSDICNSNECSIGIILNQNIARDVIVDFYTEDTLISTKIIASTTGNTVSMDECSGEVSIRCSDLNTNENCTINYQQDGMNLNKTVPLLTPVSFPLEIELFQVVINNGSIILQQSFGVLNGAGSDVAVLIVVGAILYLLGLVENLIAYAVLLRKKTKQAIGLHPWKMLILIVPTTLVFSMIAVVWIVAFINTEVSCGTLKSAEIVIHIVALVLSIMITLISTVILAVVLIVWPCTKRNPEVVEYELQKKKEKSYDFTLGMTEIILDKNKVEGKCPSCGVEWSLLVKLDETFCHKFCDVCGKQMCKDCQYSKIFVFRMMGFGHACKDCKQVYLKQNKQFADNDDSIGEMSLLWRKKCAEPCSKCNESTDTNLTCDFCDKGICSKKHVRTVTEKKEKISDNNEEKVDSEITYGTQRKDTQDKGEETSDIKTQVDSEEKGHEISEVGEKSEGLQDKQAKEHQVCRMCYTVCTRKNHFITMKEKETITKM